MLDKFTGLQVFARVAALGNLSGAARSLGMSQTMATKHMAALEERLGVKVLHRTTRRITLTEAGRRYLESTERILAEVEEADAAAMAERVEVTGVLRVNAPVSFGVRALAPLLPAFAELNPALTIDLGLNDRTVDLVEEGWDLAIRVGRIKDQSLVARRLAPCHLLLAASPEYLRTHGTPRTVAELSTHNCLGYTLSSTLGPRSWAFEKDGSHAVPIQGNLRANNGDVLVAAASAGHGLVYEPTFLVGDAIRSGGLCRVILDRPLLEVPGVYAIYAANRRPPAKVRAFIDFLVDQFGPTPPWDRDLLG
ncbi:MULTISPECIES: LysR family transcriptional regulator [unclassified Aureimonas]|uniref:LysR family transcriptional regulator n=1 Tax=unclassified Aureimonas TaxID=2615206 RepID=UPI0006F5118A|nr:MULTISPECIES: LysR family transcriptional regulator [unclassified Aureimonas]KQT52282.1 LysR family transcriptional regulator [Aureimonas sp. Leaf427]KQT61836.1 LysR family transcriptional regulator [Aureimonas sp. Leaf460]